jgi:RHS repeat-associated protein
MAHGEILSPRKFLPRNLSSYRLSMCWPYRRGAICLASIFLSVNLFAQSATNAPEATPPVTPTSTPCQTLSEEGQPACGEAAGNPINVTNGNKYQREVDMPALPGVLGLELVRHYNSAASRLSDAPSMFGRGWRISYDWAIRFDHANRNEAMILVRGDGTQIGLYKIRPHKNSSPPHASWRSVGVEQGILTEHRRSLDNEYLWTEPSGKRYRFNTKGLLISIEAPTGEFLSIERERKGDITKVTDPQGRTLVMTLLSDDVALRTKRFGGVQAVETPVGKYLYRYGGQLPQGSNVNANNILSRLISVEHAGITRHYLFEDVRQVSLLTGIRVEGAGSDTLHINQRIASWSYDQQGRAVMSMKGDQERVTLLFLPRLKGPHGIEAGSTLLTNSLGAVTKYHYKILAGRPHITEVIGPGCSTCGPTNLRHEYDASGRLLQTTYLAPALIEKAVDRKDIRAVNDLGLKAGQALRSVRYSYDAWGRPVERLVMAYRDGKPEPAQTELRFEYPAHLSTDLLPTARPSLIARPSVALGKEHRLEMSYNEQGQITQMRESGFDPIDGVAITRTTRFEYQRLQGRSVLVQIDGPSPNGPAQTPLDSDITTYQWDGKADRILKVTEPLGFVQTRSYDGAGRTIQLSNDDGVRLLHQSLRYTLNGHHALSLEEVSSLSTLLPQQYKYDALGRLTKTTDPAGRTLIREYDAANRLKSFGDAQGNRSVTDFDSEGRPSRAGLYRATQSDPLRAAYFWHDDDGRPSKRLLPDGRIDTWRYAEDGRISEHVNGDDVRSTFLRINGMSRDVAIQQSVDGDLRLHLRPQTVGVDSRRIVDDFGRTVKSKLADHGDKLAHYDAGDRLTKLIHADQSSVHYRYDTRGRLIQKQYQEASGVNQGTTTLSYKGAMLKTSVDPEQTIQFNYDSLGRRTSESVRIKGLRQTFHTTLRYDAITGLLIHRGLANDQVMEISRDSANAGASVNAIRLQSSAVAWLLRQSENHLSRNLHNTLTRHLPVNIIAENVRIDPFDGLKSFKAGNGLNTERSFDIAGRLTTQAIDKVGTTRYGYQVGPRLRVIEKLQTPEKFSHENLPPVTSAPSAISTTLDYSGFGAMLPGEAKTSGLVKVALATNAPTLQSPISFATKEPESDVLGRVVNDGRFLYAYTARGQVAEVRDSQSKQLLANYRYDSLGHRIAKTVYAPQAVKSRQEASQTTYFLWQGNNLAAEINEEGKVTVQYFYLDAGDSNQSSRVIPLAKWESKSEVLNPSKTDRLLFIHADHRGAPMAMTDRAQKVIWAIDERDNAWGAAKPAMRLVSRNDNKPVWENHQATRRGLGQLNLRLPGQYYDEETNQHDNFNRTYNPRTGRYLQPDPLGYPDGPDAYLYAAGDPVNKIDPLGLYEIDVHYYMTYFLGVMAGLNSKQALTMARATQYIDDNPNTWPVNPNNYTGNVNDAAAIRRLTLYHFTQYGKDRPATAAQTINVPTGSPLGYVYTEDYMRNRVLNPPNTQISELLGAANWLLQTDPNQELTQSTCARMQLFGEYLHAFEDTFGHRNQFNAPIPVSGGLGHGLYGTEPDKTYNDKDWRFREDRTLKMQQAVFEKIQAQFGSSAIPKIGVSIAYGDIEKVLREFNAIREHEGSAGVLFLKSEKIQLLDNVLKSYGYNPIPKYDVKRACESRKANLAGIGSHFQGLFGDAVILETPSVCVDRRSERGK